MSTATISSRGANHTAKCNPGRQISWHTRSKPNWQGNKGELKVRTSSRISALPKRPYKIKTE